MSRSYLLVAVSAVATWVGCHASRTGSNTSSQGSGGASVSAPAASGGGGAPSGSPNAAGGTGSGGASGAQAGNTGTAGRDAASGGTTGAAGLAQAAGRSGTTAGGAGNAGTGPAGVGGTAVIGGSDAGAAIQACPSSATAKPGDSNQSVMVSSLKRTYILHVPPGYNGSARVPVVIDFHPLGGTGASWKGATDWSSTADSKGFIVIWPDGYQNSWNVGRCCPPAADQKIDDVAFVRAMLEQLATNACIDPKRVYATGCSNGGGMSYKVACEAADVIAAVAPVDFDCVVGSMNDPSCGGCNAARPISETQFRATADQAVAYNGGPAPIPQGMNFPGAEKNFADWSMIDQCTGAPQPLANHAACQTHATCAGGAETSLCTQQGGSHCGNYQSLGIVDIAWEMFQKHALP